MRVLFECLAGANWSWAESLLEGWRNRFTPEGSWRAWQQGVSNTACKICRWSWCWLAAASFETH